MAAFDPQARLQRLEQQLDAFERLHGDELRDLQQRLEAQLGQSGYLDRSGDELRELQRRLEAYQRLHDDEVQLLREEIADLRAALGGDAAPAQPLNPGGSLGTAESGVVVAATTQAGTPDAAPNPADDPEVVQEAVEEAVEASLQQTVSRRQLFGRSRTDDAD